MVSFSIIKMKTVDFDTFFENYNSIGNKLNKLGYEEFIESYIKYLKKFYKSRNNTDKVLTYRMFDSITYYYDNKERTALTYGADNIKKIDLVVPGENYSLDYNTKGIKKKKVDFNLLEELGSGEFGVVSKVEIDDKIYALKEHRLDNPYVIKSYINEIKFMKKLNKIKPKISPEYFDSWIDDDKGYILTQHINCGTLNNYKKTNNLTKRDREDLKKLIDLLHKNGIIHDDLHGDNVLVECEDNKKVRFYISDFGISTTVKDLMKSEHDICGLGPIDVEEYISDNLRDFTTKEMFRDLVLDKILVGNKVELK
jgi:serine/threonine protein kinase